MSDDNRTLGRRTFLKAAGVAALARACSSDGSRAISPGDGGADGGAAPEGGMDATAADGGADAGALDAPFGVWRAMREALRSSPDSLVDQAAKLVAAKDAEGLFTFVRDNIATLPPINAATEKSQRWGAVATLRGGAGTPRERAELLSLLLGRAGFKASVVAGDPTGDLAGSSALSTVYMRSIDRTFSPADPPSSVRSWVSALTGSDNGPTIEELDPNGNQAKALFDAIDALLPSRASANGGLLALFKVPFVALEDGGTTKYLNPLSPKAVFGESYATSIGPAPDPDPLPTIEASLSISRADDPDPKERVVLVTATYGVDQLIGRQLVAHLQPAGALADIVTSPLADIIAFVPTLSVAGVDLSAMERSKLTTTGTWVTQGGDVLERAANGTVTCNGLALGDGGNDADAKNVASVEVSVNASAFPQIELSVSALDGKNKPVSGLGAGAFSLSEDGTPLPLVLRDNGSASARVLFLLDTTGSQPQIPMAWATAVSSALFAAAPDAHVQVVNLATTQASSDGYGLTDADSLTKALVGVAVGNPLSNLYGAILSAVASTPTLVILLSDGTAEDKELGDRAMRSLVGSAPVLAVTSAVMTPVADSPVMDAFASVSGGKNVDGGNLSDATPVTSALTQMVGGRVTMPYRLSYMAPARGASKRTVTVTVNAKGTGTYDVPAQPAATRAVAGLYLSLKLANPTIFPEESCTRVLGGFVPGSDPTDKAALDAAVADARAAMLGTAVISFEGAAPSLSTLLGDVIDSRLATEPASMALGKGDLTAAIAALGQVPATIPRESVGLHAAPLPVSNAIVYEEMLRAVLFCTRTSAPVYRADILPFTRLTTASTSSTLDVFRTNLRSSLRLAIAESAQFQTSTVSELDGKALQFVDFGGVTVADVPQVPTAQRARFVNALNQYDNCYRFIAKDGSSLAFWAVHPHGSCFGVLPDGSGGGQDPCADYRALANMLDMLALFSDILGVPALSLWAEIGKLVALAGVETLLAFNYTPVMVTGEGQANAITCGFASGLLGTKSLSSHFKQVGVTTVATNYMQASMVNTVVGSFSVCSGSGNPCTK